jgi:catechol 2,3-dioxygenase-like lactoylglutathione lyase family enzyme
MNMADVNAARSFYGASLGTLGLTESVDPFGRVDYSSEGHSEFGFYGAAPQEYYEHAHIAFVAPDRASVDGFYREALAHGGTSIDAPKERPEFGYYSAYIRDPDGNGVEVGVRLD